MKTQDNGSVTFQRLYNEIFPVIMRVAYHITADTDISEELCQEAFLRYYRRAIHIEDPEQIKYWLLRVVKNLCLNYVKRRGREKKALERYAKNKSDVHTSGETEALKNESSRQVRSALRSLPQSLGTVLILKEYAGLNYSEIAKVMRISEGNVKVRVHRARKQLKELLDREDPYVP